MGFLDRILGGSKRQNLKSEVPQMAYYRVLFGSDYSKRKGRYGIVRSLTPVNDHALKDGQPFPADLLTGLVFELEGDGDKAFADFQMCYMPWRMVSESVFNILQPLSRPDLVEFHPIEIRSEHCGTGKYYIMHFPKTLAVIIEDEHFKTYGTMKARINVNAAEGVDVFLWNSFDPGPFIISERVKNAFEDAGLTGMTFQTVT